MHRALRLLFERYRDWPGAVSPVLTVHDEILVEADAASADQVGALLADAMVEAFRDVLPERADEAPGHPRRGPDLGRGEGRRRCAAEGAPRTHHQPRAGQTAERPALAVTQRRPPIHAAAARHEAAIARREANAIRQESAEANRKRRAPKARVPLERL